MPSPPKLNAANAKAPGELIVQNPANVDTVLEAMFDGVYFVDRERRILSWNDGATRLSGFSAEELKGRFCCDNILCHVDEKGTELCKAGCPLHETLNDAQPRQGLLFLRHKHGYRVPVLVRTTAIRDADGNVVGAVETFRELGAAELWKSRITELERAAFIDLITGIPNRRFLETQVHRLLREFDSVGEPFSMCMLDIDHFKSVNDEYGHEVGDHVLRAVGQTLLNCLRSTDMVGRWGGDEFVLLLPRAGKERAEQVAERSRLLVGQTATPSATGAVSVTVSIGVAVIGPGDDRKNLLARVDEQLYRAKAQGRNCCSVP